MKTRGGDARSPPPPLRRGQRPDSPAAEVRTRTQRPTLTARFWGGTGEAVRELGQSDPTDREPQLSTDVGRLVRGRSGDRDSHLSRVPRETFDFDWTGRIRPRSLVATERKAGRLAQMHAPSVWGYRKIFFPTVRGGGVGPSGSSEGTEEFFCFSS